jgi:alanine dehydrogenase
METLLLSQSEVRSLISMREAVDAVEEAFAAHGRGETLMPSKVYLDLDRYRGDFRAMPAYFAGAAGLKWVNAHPENPTRHGLPTVRGMYILSDPATAEPLAVMDATWLTAVRTGASAAVATKYLARPQARTLGFVGAGAQARTLLAALRVLRDDFEIIVADKNADAAAAFAGEAGGKIGSLAEAAGCDIVCTATPSTTPILERSWIRPGTHINAMGADGHGKQELELQILLDGLVVVDDLAQAQGSGEINVPIDHGLLGLQDLGPDLGEIVAGIRPGRSTDSEITVFDSTGLAIQDVAVARIVYQAARAQGVGRTLDFFA